MRAPPCRRRRLRVGAAVAFSLAATASFGVRARAADLDDDAPSEPGPAKPAPKPPAPADEAPALDVPAAPAAPASGDGVRTFDRPYLRLVGGEIVLHPGARLQVDAAFFPRQNPKSGAYLRRARLELSGWLTRAFYFDVAGDFTPAPPGGPASVAPSALSPPDAYLGWAAAGETLMVQVGQFDAPFTLENRTSDAYTDFIERSMVSRSLGAPRNKEVGAMIHGLVGQVFYYSAGVFNGEGPGFRNVDNQPDAIGRVVLAPFGFSRISIGASGWYGMHVLGPAFPLQATPGGVTFFSPRWLTGQSPVATMELRENGTLSAGAAELNLPVGHHSGFRAEGVLKRQNLSEADVSFVASGGAPTPLGHAFLNGLAAYGEFWFWLVGDDRQLPAPGLQLPAPFDAARLGARAPLEDGLMLALRGEVIKEDLTTDRPDLGDPNRATTRVISGTAGLNYWRGHLVRVSVNYVLNVWSGTSENIRVLRAAGTLEHEVMARFALSL